MKPLVLILARSENGVIGKDGGLPWHIPEDLKHFKRNTIGHAIIMGRKTYESIGRPLPKRRNIVVTSNRALAIEGCDVVHSLDEAVALARTEDDEPRIVGGATLYIAALPIATRIYLTDVLRTVEGDTFFPELGDEWREVERTEGDGVVFRTMDRVNPS